MSSDTAVIVEESVSLCRLLQDRLSRLRDAVDVRSASPRSEDAFVTEQVPAACSSRSPSQAPAVVQPPTLSTHGAAAQSFSADAARSDASERLIHADAQARRRQRPRLLDEAAAEASVTAPEESALYNIDEPPHPLSPMRRRGSLSDATTGASQHSPAAMGANRGSSTRTLRAENGTLGRMHAGLTLQHDSDSDVAVFGAATRAGPAALQPLPQQQSAVVLLPAAGGVVAVSSPTSHLQRQLIASPQAQRPASAASASAAQPCLDAPQEVVALPLEPLSPPMRIAVAAAESASSQMDRLDAAVRHAMAVAAAMRAQLGPATAPSHVPAAAVASLPAAAAVGGFTFQGNAAGRTGSAPARPFPLGFPWPGMPLPADVAPAPAPAFAQGWPQREQGAMSPARHALALSLLTPPLPARKHAPRAEGAGAAPPPELSKSGSLQPPAPGSAPEPAESSARSSVGVSASARSLESNSGSGAGSSAAAALLLPRQPLQPPLSSSPLTVPGEFAPAAAAAATAAAVAPSAATQATRSQAAASSASVADASPPSLSPPSALDAERQSDRDRDRDRDMVERAEERSLRPAVASASAPRASAAPSTSVSAPAPASVRRLPRSATSSGGAGAGAAAAGGADTLWDSPDAPAQQARTAAASSSSSSGGAAANDGILRGPADGAMRIGADTSASGVTAGSDHQDGDRDRDRSRDAADTSAASTGADPSQWLLGPSSGSEPLYPAAPLHHHHDHDGERGGRKFGGTGPQQRNDDVAAALGRLRRAAAAARAPLSGIGAESAAAPPALHASAAAFSQPVMMVSQRSIGQQLPQPAASAASLQPHVLPMLSLASLASGSESAADASVRAANEAIMALAAALQRV